MVREARVGLDDVRVFPVPSDVARVREGGFSQEGEGGGEVGRGDGVVGHRHAVVFWGPVGGQGVRVDRGAVFSAGGSGAEGGDERGEDLSYVQGV